eukprot:2703242-Amphidinium_carterae.1
MSSCSVLPLGSPSVVILWRRALANPPSYVYVKDRLRHVTNSMQVNKSSTAQHHVPKPKQASRDASMSIFAGIGRHSLGALLCGRISSPTQ